jgi:hypothetical protein
VAGPPFLFWEARGKIRAPLDYFRENRSVEKIGVFSIPSAYELTVQRARDARVIALRLLGLS